MSIIDTRLTDIDRLEQARRRVKDTDPQRARQLRKTSLKLQEQLDKELEPLMKLCEPWQLLK